MKYEFEIGFELLRLEANIIFSKIKLFYKFMKMSKREAEIMSSMLDKKIVGKLEKGNCNSTDDYPEVNKDIVVRDANSSEYK